MRKSLVETGWVDFLQLFMYYVDIVLAYTIKEQTKKENET